MAGRKHLSEAEILKLGELKKAGELTIPQIAAELGCSAATVINRTKQGLKAVRARAARESYKKPVRGSKLRKAASLAAAPVASPPAKPMVCLMGTPRDIAQAVQELFS